MPSFSSRRLRVPLACASTLLLPLISPLVAQAKSQPAPSHRLDFLRGQHTQTAPSTLNGLFAHSLLPLPQLPAAHSLSRGSFLLVQQAPNNPPIFNGTTIGGLVDGGINIQFPTTDSDGDTLTYQVTQGTLPVGLTLTSAGLLDGAARDAGNTNTTVTVSDGRGGTATGALDFQIRESPFRGDLNKIYFSSNRDGKTDIYAMNSDGTGVTQITRTEAPFENLYVDVSRDGTKLVFQRTGVNTNEIVTMNVDGTEQKSISSQGGIPKWSPDGSKIAGVFAGPGGGIGVVNADGSNAQRIFAFPPEENETDISPTWSPDGKKLAFISQRKSDPTGNIYIVNVDGSGVTRVTNDTDGFKQDLTWSPSGEELAFRYEKSDAEGKGTAESGIYLVKLDGSSRRQLLSGVNSGAFLNWSPFSSQLTFFSGQQGDGNNEIYTLNTLDGKLRPINVSNNVSSDTYPAYSSGTFAVAPGTPQAASENFTLTKNGSVAMFLQVQPSRAALTYTIVAPPLHGTLSGEAPNLVYTPEAGYSGTDRFRFKALNTRFGSESNVATISLSIGDNSAPTISAIPDQNYEVGQGFQIQFGALPFVVGDAETPAEELVVTAASSNPDFITASALSFEGVGANRGVTGYTNRDVYSTSRITLTVRDKDGATAQTSFNITLKLVNTPPYPGPTGYSVTPGVPTSDAILTYDVDNDPLTYTLVQGPRAGSLDLRPDGTFTYTPSSSFGPEGDTFTFNVSDPTGPPVGPTTVYLQYRNETNLVVTTTADTVNPNDGKLSLREALLQEDPNRPTTERKITFNFGTAGGLKAQTIKLKEALPDIKGQVTIANTGQAPIILKGSGKARIFNIPQASSLNLQAMQLDGGRADVGGAILNRGGLRLVGCTLTNNQAAQGGAVANIAIGNNFRNFEAYNTTFAANGRGKGNAGGVAARGSAFYSTGGGASLVNSTLVGAKGESAALVTIENGTDTQLLNTILDAKGGTTLQKADEASRFTSQGGNLTSDNPSALILSRDVLDKVLSDPMLAPLSISKGDPVSTYLLKPGSPARNSGSGAVFQNVPFLQQDARGQNRLQGSAVDIGAVEMPNLAPSGSFASKEKGVVGTPVTFTTSWRDLDGAQDIRGAQAYFAAGAGAKRNGPVLRLAQVDGSTEIRVFFLDSLNATPVDITEATKAGTASTAWFSNLSYKPTISSDGTLSVEWKFTPLTPLIGDRKAFLSAVDQGGAGGLGLGAPFGSLKITAPKSNGGGKANAAQAPSSNES